MSAGKGGRYRPVNQEKYGENYERIFGEKDTRTQAKRLRRITIRRTQRDTGDIGDPT